MALHTDRRDTERPWTSMLWAILWLITAFSLGSSVARAGSCDGFADYRNELHPSNFQLASQTDLGDGFSIVEVGFDLQNLDVGDFVSGSVSVPPWSLGNDLVVEEVISPGTLGTITPNGMATPSSNLELRVPTVGVASLIADLESGAIPLTVHAAEREVLAPGVEIIEWTEAEDGYYALARDSIVPAVNDDPGPPPYAPGEVFGIKLLAYYDGAGSIFDAFDGSGSLYVVPGEFVPVEVPEAMHYARVLDVLKSDEESGSDSDDNATVWTVTLARTDTERLPEIYSSASFCTGTSTHIDLPVQATRIATLDGDAQDEEERDGNPQPIHWNGLEVETGITLSGQLTGHVLKPSLEVRLREGRVYAAASIDTDLSLTAELRADASVAFADQLSLYDLCFPLPDLVAGPIPIGLNLQLEHWVGAEGEARAGAVVGFQKSFRAGHTVGFDGSRPEGERYFSEPRHEQPQPVEFTPPHLVDETGVTFAVSTELRTTLRVGAQYPFCETGAGAYLGARARGELEIVPLQDPWWVLGHDAEVFAGINLEILGLEIANHDTGARLFPGNDTLDSGGPLMLGAAPASMASFMAAPSETGPQIISGDDHRWAFAIDGVGVPNGVDETTLADRGELGVLATTSEDIGGRNELIALDRYGALDWTVGYASMRKPRSVLPLPDGTILVVGAPSWYARHGIDGALLESKDVIVSDDAQTRFECVVGRAVAIEEPAGGWGYVAVGHHGSADIRQRDACAYRVDAAGNLVWARIYSESGAQELYDVIHASDGRIVAVGEAETGPDVYSLDNPLIVSIDAETGDPVWAKTMPFSFRGAHFGAIAEAVDGTLFAAGAAGRPINKTGAALIARIDADGGDARHALIIQDEEWELEIDAASYVDSEGGDTPYDEIFDLVADGDGVFFVGRTGLGDDTSAWAGRVNLGLGLEWFRSFDGEGADALDGIALTEGGLLVSGFSRSLASYAPEDDSQLWLMKLSRTGSTLLEAGAGVASRFIAPGVRASSGDATLVPGGLVSMDAPLLVTDAMPESSTLVIDDLLDDPGAFCVTRLSVSGHESSASACDPIPLPEPQGMLVVGCGVLWGLRRARGRRSSSNRSNAPR